MRAANRPSTLCFLAPAPVASSSAPAAHVRSPDCGTCRSLDFSTIVPWGILSS